VGHLREPAGLPPALTDLGRSLVMGVLNVTPDSFSDGGRYLLPDAAVAHGLALMDAGADLVDIGGESTRPGAARVSAQVELDRVLPVVTGLVERGVPVSIDTTRAEVAIAALRLGASVVNDVSGGLADPGMLPAVAQARCPYVVMHWRGPSTVMEELAVYDDAVSDVRWELSERVNAAMSAGVDPAFVVLDPGLGFAKTAEHNWQLLAGLDELAGLGRPLLVGASRKRFLGSLLAKADGDVPDHAPAGARDQATAAVSALAAAAGVWCVRVHEPGSSLDAVRVAAAWRAAGRTG
jgi:dihydropteroate synthase